MKAKHIRNRQLHMEPLGRLSQGTRYFDALVETSLYAGEGREVQETSDGRRGKGWDICAFSTSITIPRDLPSHAPAPQRLCYKVLTSTEWKRRTRRFRNLMEHEI